MDAPTDVGPRPDPSAAPGPPRRSGPRRLRRRPDDGYVAGVCAGVAEYFHIDPVIVRIAAVVLVFSGGTGVVAYILAWIFVPEAHGPMPHGVAQPPVDRRDRGLQIFGIVLLCIALSIIWDSWWWPAGHWLLPLGLMALGGWLLLRGDTRGGDEVPTPPPPPPVPPTPVWAWGGAPTGATPTGEATTPVNVDAPTDAADPTATLDDPTSTLPTDDDGDATGGGPPTAPWDVPPPPVPPGAPPALPVPTRRRRVLGPIVFGSLLIWAGLAWLTDVSPQTALAVGLLIIGLGFVLGSFVGGSRALILPALLVGSALAVTAVVDIPLHGPIGEQRWAPLQVEDVEDLYEVSMGEGTLDLTAIGLPPGGELEIEATVGLGKLLVLVPADIALDVVTEVGAGESQFLELQQTGIGITTDQQADGADTNGTLVLDLQVGMGQIEVRRAFGAISSPTTTATTVLG